MSKPAAPTDAPAAEAKTIDVAAVAQKILANVEKVIIGKRAQISLCLVAYFCEGHILLEDVPGVAKTMLARALARSVGCIFKRLQCTPDLLPTDVTGVSIFNQKTAEFEFRPGPLFAQTVLADEINRTTPRTQSALLEAMAERRISVDGTTYTLKPPFLVMATQNPIDHEGTFPLPEAQLDRFLIKLSLGYPSLEEEGRMLDRMQHSHPIDDLPTVATAAEVIACQEAIRSVYIDNQVRNYLLQIVEKTRNHEDVRLGGSPRASIALYRTSQAVAAMAGRNYVLPDDVKRMVMSVLAHRIILRPESRLRKVTPITVLQEILPDVAVPVPASKKNQSEDHFR
jgi:MoxR-like ATPase